MIPNTVATIATIWRKSITKRSENKDEITKYTRALEGTSCDN